MWTRGGPPARGRAPRQSFHRPHGAAEEESPLDDSWRTDVPPDSAAADAHNAETFGADAPVGDDWQPEEETYKDFEMLRQRQPPLEESVAEPGARHSSPQGIRLPDFFSTDARGAPVEVVLESLEPDPGPLGSSSGRSPENPYAALHSSQTTEHLDSVVLRGVEGVEQQGPHELLELQQQKQFDQESPLQQHVTAAQQVGPLASLLPELGSPYPHPLMQARGVAPLLSPPGFEGADVRRMQPPVHQPQPPFAAAATSAAAAIIRDPAVLMAEPASQPLAMGSTAGLRAPSSSSDGILRDPAVQRVVLLNSVGSAADPSLVAAENAVSGSQYRAGERLDLHPKRPVDAAPLAWSSGAEEEDLWRSASSGGGPPQRQLYPQLADPSSMGDPPFCPSQQQEQEEQQQENSRIIAGASETAGKQLNKHDLMRSGVSRSGGPAFGKLRHPSGGREQHELQPLLLGQGRLPQPQQRSRSQQQQQQQQGRRGQTQQQGSQQQEKGRRCSKQKQEVSAASSSKGAGSSSSSSHSSASLLNSGGQAVVPPIFPLTRGLIDLIIRQKIPDATRWVQLAQMSRRPELQRYTGKWNYRSFKGPPKGPSADLSCVELECAIRELREPSGGGVLPGSLLESHRVDCLGEGVLIVREVPQEEGPSSAHSTEGQGAQALHATGAFRLKDRSQETDLVEKCSTCYVGDLGGACCALQLSLSDTSMSPLQRSLVVKALVEDCQDLRLTASNLQEELDAFPLPFMIDFSAPALCPSPQDYVSRLRHHYLRQQQPQQHEDGPLGSLPPDLCLLVDKGRRTRASAATANGEDGLSSSLFEEVMRSSGTTAAALASVQEGMLLHALLHPPEGNERATLCALLLLGTLRVFRASGPSRAAVLCTFADILCWGMQQRNAADIAKHTAGSCLLALLTLHLPKAEALANPGQVDVITRFLGLITDALVTLLAGGMQQQSAAQHIWRLRPLIRCLLQQARQCPAWAATVTTKVT
ncbi:hypothetical protein cyc_05126 [Cyclospora cayetanensis]|uniref:Uncharacterized protein n=1 Tax=Cyclospora cayetanensis TaxID=88456 RepID=A0A1D3D7Z3_9EIME|nr:hypothetical protein cyc_05126 [Cyclospora cayetanensis]